MRFQFRQQVALPPAEVARLVDSPAAVAYLMWPLLRLLPLDGPPGERFRAGPQRFRVRLLGVIPAGVQTIDVSWPLDADHVLLDVGGNGFTRRYAHRIAVTPELASGGALCVDDTEIDAGVLTLPVSLGFWLVNLVVQRRWRRIARLVASSDARRVGFAALLELPASTRARNSEES